MQPLLEALNQTGFETTFEEVAHIVGITEVNNCEIYNSDGLTGIRGLFPVTSLMSHKYLFSYIFFWPFGSSSDFYRSLVVSLIVELFSIMKNPTKATVWLPKELSKEKN